MRPDTHPHHSQHVSSCANWIVRTHAAESGTRSVFGGLTPVGVVRQPWRLQGLVSKNTSPPLRLSPPPLLQPMLNITRLDVPQRYDACAFAAGRCTGTAQRQVPSARSQLPCQSEFFAVESCRQCRLDRLDTVESGDSTRKTHAVCENRYSSVHTHRLPSFVMVLCQHSTTLRMGD